MGLRVPGKKREEEEKKPKRTFAPSLKKQDEFFRAVREPKVDENVPVRHVTPYDIVMDQRARSLNFALDEGAQLDPKALRRLFDVMGRTGLPHDFVNNNFEALEKEVMAPDWDYRAWVEKSPTVSKFFVEHPMYVKGMSDEDKQRMGSVEHRLRLLKKDPLMWQLSDEYLTTMAEALSREQGIGEMAERAAKKGFWQMLGLGPAADVLARRKTMEDFLEELKAEEAYIQGEGATGAYETVKKRFRENPAFLAPFIGAVVDAAKVKEIYDAAKAVEAGTASDAQRFKLVRFMRLAIAAEERGHNVLGNVATIVSEMPAFVGEFAATGGVFSGVRGLAVGGAKAAAQSFLRRAAMKATGFVLGSFVQTAAASPGRVAKGTIERMTPGIGIEIADGRWAVSIHPEQAEPFLIALPAAYYHAWTELASERFGSAAFMKAMDSHLNQTLFKAYLRVRPGKLGRAYREMLERFPGQGQKAFRKFIKKNPEAGAGFRAALERGGINGVLGEFSEERLAAFLQGERIIPEGEQILAELIAFAIPHVPGAIASTFSTDKLVVPPGQSEGLIRALHLVMRDSDLSKEAPEAVERLIREVAEATGQKEFYIPAEDWIEYWEEQGRDPQAEWVRMTGDVAVYEEETGDQGSGQLPMATEVFIKEISPSTELTNALIGSKVNQSEMSIKEYHQDLSDELGTWVQQRMEEAGIVEEEMLSQQELEEQIAATNDTLARMREEREGVEDGSKAAEDLDGEIADTESALRAAENQVKLIEVGKRAPEGVPVEERAKIRRAREVAREATAAEERSVNNIRTAVREALMSLKLNEVEGMRGLTEAQADLYAAVWAERYRQRGRLLGQDPFALFRQERVGIEVVSEEGVVEQVARTFLQEARGRARFVEEGIFIGFFRKANRSTFLHETGHIWLDEIGRDYATVLAIPEEERTIQQDRFARQAEAVLKYLDVKSFDEIGDEQHEKWARSAEVYFMQGQAPSRTLRDAFRTFASWLVRIYKEKVLGITLAPEIKDIMDRLLASEQQIAVARQSQAVEALFVDPKAVGMNEQQAAKYLEDIEEANAIAIEEFFQKRMEIIRRREAAAALRRRREIEAEERERIERRRDVIAYSILINGTMPDGSVPEFGNGQRPQKLARQSIIEDGYGEAVLDLLPPAAVAKEGINADQLKENLNSLEAITEEEKFESGDEVITALLDIQQEELAAHPSTTMRAELEASLKQLQEQERRLAAEVEALWKEQIQVKRKLTRDQRTLAEEIHRELTRAERQGTEELRRLLQLIADTGVAPIEGEVEEWEEIPDRYKKKEKGRLADDWASEILEDHRATAQQFYDWLITAEHKRLESRRKIKEDIPGQAEALAVSERKVDVKRLLDTVRNRENVQKELDAVKQQAKQVTRDLQVRGSVQSIVDRAVDERMDQEVFETKSEAEIYDEAIQAVYNEKNSLRMQAELKWLISNRFKTFKELTRAVSEEKVRSPAEYREGAREAVGKKPIRRISAAAYERSARRAGRIAIREMMRGNYEGAFRARIAQLEWFEMARAAIEAQQEIEKGIQLAKDLKKKPRRQAIGRAGEDFLEQIDRILELYEFVKVPTSVLANRESLNKWIKEQKEKGEQPNVPQEVIDRAAKINFQDITLDEFREVINSLKHIAHLASRKNKLISEKKAREMNELAERVVKSIVENSKKHRKLRKQAEKIDKMVAENAPKEEIKAEREKLIKIQESIVGTVSGRTNLEKFGNTLRGLFFMNRTLDNLINLADGFEDGGLLFKTVMMRLIEASANEVEMRRTIMLELREIMPDYSILETWRKSRREVIEELGGVSLNKDDLISIAMNWGNADNRAGILARFKQKGYPVTEEQLEQVVFRSGRLTDEEIRYVDEVWKLLGRMWPKIKALSERVDGIAPERVGSIPIETPIGTIAKEDGYFPIVHDPEMIERTHEQNVEEHIRRVRDGLTFRGATKSGRRKERIKELGWPVLLDTNVLYTVLEDMIHDLTHYEVMLDLQRLLRRKDVRDAMVGAYGQKFYREILMTLGAVTAADNANHDELDALAGAIRRGTTISVLGVKMTTAFMQFFGLANAIPEVGPEWIVKGVKSIGGGVQAGEETAFNISEKSLTMRNRGLTQDRDINEIRNTTTFRGKILRGVEAWSMYLIIRAQKLVDNIVWSATYQREKARLGKPSSLEETEAFEKEAIAIADQMVLRTQGGGTIKDLTRLQRIKGVVSLFTMFGTYFIARTNLAVKRFGQRFANGFSMENAGLFAADFITIFWLPEMLAGFAMWFLRGGDDEDMVGKIIADAALSPISDLMFVREIVGPLKGYRYRGPAGVKLVADLEDAVHGSNWRGLMGMAGILLHIPTEQFESMIRGGGALLDGTSETPTSILFGPPPGFRRPKR